MCVEAHHWDYIMCHSVFRSQACTAHHCVFQSIGVSAPRTIICTYRTISKGYMHIGVRGGRTSGSLAGDAGVTAARTSRAAPVASDKIPSESVIKYALGIDCEFCVKTVAAEHKHPSK